MNRAALGGWSKGGGALGKKMQSKHSAQSLVLAVICLASLAGVVQAKALERAPGEAAQHFAERVLRLPLDSKDTHVTEARWNNTETLFVDFPHMEAREVVALQRMPHGGYRQIAVTTGEEEGGRPDIAAIGFANADQDAAEELIVILAWPVQHFDVSGTLYEVRILDDAKPGQARLFPLAAVSRQFAAHTCDCGWRDGKSDHFPFKTVADVKGGLKRLGF